MNVGNAVRFAEPGGSWGVIEEVTHYSADTFYVRWYYGLIANGEQWTALSAVHRDKLAPLPRSAFLKHKKMRAFSKEQKQLHTETLRQLAKAALARHAQTIRAKRRRR